MCSSDLQQQIAEHRRNLALQLGVKAAESGAITPDQFAQLSGHMGLPPIPVGPDAATQLKIDEAKRLQQEQFAKAEKQKLEKQIADLKAKQEELQKKLAG